MIMGTNAQMVALANIVVGLLGGVIGGFGLGDPEDFKIASLLVAILGAVILIAIVRLFTRGTRTI